MIYKSLMHLYDTLLQNENKWRCMSLECKLGGPRKNGTTQENWLDEGNSATKREQMPVCISLKCV